MIDPVLIDVPMPIRTPRLLLMPLRPGLGGAVAEAVAETWDDLRRWMPWADTLDNNTADQKEIYCRQQAARFLLREDLTMIGFERDGGRPVLFTGLHGIAWARRSFDIGYWVRRSAQGRGYATEGANALLRFAFGALNAVRVGTGHATGNNASRKVIEKLGFEPEGLVRKDVRLGDGTLLDSRMYARLDLAGLPPLDISWDNSAVRNEP